MTHWRRFFAFETRLPPARSIHRKTQGTGMPKSAADFGFRNVPMIERLEGRQLLSADLVGSFAGAIPQDLEPAMSNHLVVRLSNTGNARAAGQATVSLYASTDSTLDA